MKDIINQNLNEITDEFVISNPVLLAMHKEANQIQDYLSHKADIDNPASLTYRLNDLDAYLARVSDMQIRAKAMKEYAKTTFLLNNEDKLSKMTATNSNRMIATYLYEFSITAERLEALYSLLSSSCKNLITQISFIKQQMQMH